MKFANCVWALLAGAMAVGNSAGQVRVRDVFDRSLNERGLTLVDWDGYMANPLIKFYLLPPTNAALPGSVTLSADGARLYFDNPSTVSSNGPTTTRSLRRRHRRVPVGLSIFPKHTDMDISSTLTIVFTDAHKVNQTNTIPIRILDLNTHRSNDFHVTGNFDRDTTGFFTNPVARFIVQQAADDWAYYFDGMNLDPVPAGTEKSWIWTGGDECYAFTNTNAYTGFLLYAHGVTNFRHISGGNGNDSGCQSSGGRPLPLRRSGDYEANVAGNYNTLGWLFLTNDTDWLASENGDATNDFYSVAHHEIGHALIFNDNHPGFPVRHFLRGVAFTDDAVKKYYGRRVPIDVPDDHLSGVIDPESGQPAFGNEYDGNVPSYRWIITKLDLLCAQELGYTLRSNATFATFTFPAATLPTATIGVAYNDALKATGGIPIYNWQVSAGSLPPGISLDPFSGSLGGVPTVCGSFKFTIHVRDYHEKAAGLTREFKLNVWAGVPRL